MAQTGYTPIQLYSSSTTGNTPAAADLLNSTGGSELAINIFDGKLFYKDNAGVVQVIGWKVVPTTAGGTGQTTYTDGEILIGNSTGNTLTKTTLTAGANITITNAPGSITIAATGGGGGMTYPGAGIANSTGSAWGTSYTTSGSGTVVTLSDSPTFTTAITSTGSLQLTGDATSTQNIATNMTTGTLNIGGNALSAINLNSPTFFGSEVIFSTATYISDLTLGTAASPSALTVYGSSTFGTSAVPQNVFFFGSFNQSFGQCTFAGSAAGGMIFGSAQTTGQMTFGSASQTGAITLGQSTQTQTVNIATGVPASTKTKTVNIGTSATTAAGTTNIAIGSTTGTSTTTHNGTNNYPALTASQAVFTDASKNLVSVATTGTGSVVLGTAPTITLTNGTGLPIGGISATGTPSSTTYLRGDGTWSTVAGGGVTSVTGTAPVVSSGGTTPAISMAAATTSVSGYLTSTDWNTFNNKQPAGSYLTAVTADAPLSGSGTSGSHLVISQANTTTNGYLSSTDWSTFNGKAPGVTFTTNYVPYGQGTTTLNQSAGLQFDGTNFTTTGYATATAFIPSSATIPTNGLYLPAANALGFATASTNRMTIDASGNLGVGVTPSAWNTTFYVPLQIGLGGTIYGSKAGGSAMWVGANTFKNSGNVDTYITTAAATQYSQLNGVHAWSYAASGTAGNPITFTTAMQVGATGGVSIGNTTDPGATNLSVTGATNSASFIPTSATVPTNGIYLPAANTVAIATNTTERLRINASGAWGLSGATYGTAGQVLISGGSSAAPTWATVGGLGTVTSVSGTGTVNGLTLTGTVTTIGSLTLGGTLDLSSPPAIGGTSASTGAFTYISTSSSTSTTPTLSFNASNSPYAAGATISGSYLQHMLQNKSATAGASTNYVLSNDSGTDSTFYGEFGMNSSVFSASTPADYFSINNGIYFSGHDGDVTVGSGNGFKTYLAWGTTGQSAHVVNASGAIGLNTNLGTTPALSGTTNFGTAGQVLTSAGSAATPTWSSTPTLTATNFTGTASININGTVGATTPTTGKFTTITYSAGTASAGGAPIYLTSGTNLTAAAAGAIEYDGVNFYATAETTSGRNVIPEYQQFYLSSNVTAFGAASGDFFGGTSSASLAATTAYDIECFCYFLKTTAGTGQWIPTFSTALTVGHSYLEYTPVTGFTTTVITGAMVVAEATQQTTAVLTHAATASLTSAVNHIAKLRIRVLTNTACNFRLKFVGSAGTITPQAGSWYTVRKVASNAGNFVA